MKIVATVLISMSVAASAQTIPPPISAFTYSGSSWIKAVTTSSLNPLDSSPPPAALYCYNSSLAKWVPADSSCFGGSGSGTVNAGTTGQLAYYAGNGTAVSGATAFSNSPPFTPQSSFASQLSFSGNSLNFGTEWNTIYSAYMPNAYPSDVFDVGVKVPNTSTVFQTNAFGAFVNCSQPSGLHYCVALYGQGVRGAAGSQVSVINGNGSDNNLSGILVPGEFNSQVFNVGTTGATLIVTANITNAGTAYDGLDLGGYGSTGSYKYGINIADNSATTGINMGKLTASGGSMPIQFYNGTLLANLALNSSNLFQFSYPVTAPSYSTSTNCVSSASPAVCASASAGIVAVPAGGTTLVVNTNVVGANSEIFLTFDSSLGTALGVTCNTSVNQPTVSARTAATSFTITMGSSVTTNPACVSYHIVNAALAPNFQMTDTFTGANNTTLSSHTADTGQTWAQMNQSVWTGTLHLNGSNAAVGGIAAYFTSLIPSSANYTVSAGANITSTGSGWIMILGRVTNQSSTTFNGYACRFTEGTGLILEKWTNASNSALGTTDTTYTTGTHTIGLKMLGTTITCQRDGVDSSQATATDSTYSAVGTAGLAVNVGSGSANSYVVNSPFTVQ